MNTLNLQQIGLADTADQMRLLIQELSKLNDAQNLDAVYTPGAPTSWAGTPPATIGAALDRLAALVKVLNSGTGA